MKKKLKPKQIKELEGIIVDVTRKSGEVRRAQAVLMLSRCIATETIKPVTGLSKSRIFGLYAAYLRDGDKALRDKRQGKPKELLMSSTRFFNMRIGVNKV